MWMQTVPHPRRAPVGSSRSMGRWSRVVEPKPEVKRWVLLVQKTATVLLGRASSPKGSARALVAKMQTVKSVSCVVMSAILFPLAEGAQSGSKSVPPPSALVMLSAKRASFAFAIPAPLERVSCVAQSPTPPKRNTVQPAPKTATVRVAFVVRTPTETFAHLLVKAVRAMCARSKWSVRPPQRAPTTHISVSRSRRHVRETATVRTVKFAPSFSIHSSGPCGVVLRRSAPERQATFVILRRKLPNVKVASATH